MTETPSTSGKIKILWIVLAFVAIVVAAIAWKRSGLLGLPSVPRNITAEQAGLANLEAQRQLDHYLRDDSTNVVPSGLDPKALDLASQGIRAIREGDAPSGLDLLRQSIVLAPNNLVLGNAYRMEVFQLRRAYLAEARSRGELTPQFPDHLHGQPIAFFERLTAEHPSRETKLQLALAWVDEMLLFPALEIKAPASVEAVNLLTDVIENGNEFYVPALFARGLNHLHRPARLVWPETTKTPLDAAARDIGKCIAIGRRVRAGSDRLHAIMAMTLGDAYVKAGRFDVARSWWQIAQNLSRDADIAAAIRRRYGWSNEEILDRLEAELDRARSELERPMTDLTLMWE